MSRPGRCRALLRLRPLLTYELFLFWLSSAAAGAPAAGRPSTSPAFAPPHVHVNQMASDQPVSSVNVSHVGVSTFELIVLGLWAAPALL